MVEARRWPVHPSGNFISHSRSMIYRYLFQEFLISFAKRVRICYGKKNREKKQNENRKKSKIKKRKKRRREQFIRRFLRYSGFSYYQQRTSSHVGRSKGHEHIRKANVWRAFRNPSDSGFAWQPKPNHVRDDGINTSRAHRRNRWHERKREKRKRKEDDAKQKRRMRGCREQRS